MNFSEDERKVGLLRGFPYANTRLVLFEADIYKPDEFGVAIEGCEFVFHIATPFQHQIHSQVDFTKKSQKSKLVLLYV